MEAMTPSSWKRAKSAGRRTWACSMRRGGGAWRGCCEVERWAAVVERGGDGDLPGGGEGVERDGVGFVADGVEAELEAGGGALFGHVVEVGLLVARDAGVVGVVGVGFREGGGAGAEGSVHEALEHAEVKERVVGVVGGAARLKSGEGEVEVEPLGDAEVEGAGVFHGLEREPVVPVGEVLNGGDAVRERVGDGEVEGFAADVGRGGRDPGVDRGRRRGTRGRCRWECRLGRGRSCRRVGRAWPRRCPAARRAAELATTMWPSVR